MKRQYGKWPKSPRTQTEKKVIRQVPNLPAHEAELAKALKKLLDQGKGHVVDQEAYTECNLNLHLSVAGVTAGISKSFSKLS